MPAMPAGSSKNAQPATGMISKLLDWVTNAYYDNSGIEVWVYGLVFVLILSFMWSTVVRQVLD